MIFNLILWLTAPLTFQPISYLNKRIFLIQFNLNLILLIIFLINVSHEQATLTPQLPTMVGVAEVAPLSAEGTATDTVPIATDIVPPDDLFNNDDVDWLR